MQRISRVRVAILLMVLTCPSAFAQKQVDKTKPQAVVPALRLTTAAPAGILQYVPDDVVIVAAAQPARVINSKGLQGLIAATKGQDVLEEILQQGLKATGFNPAEVEEVAVILDRQTVAEMTDRAGRQAQEMAQLNGMKQIGLAMHNFHDVHNSFPDDDGIDDGNKGNLSWRVHLLPYLEQAGLYNQFHLDEPWDSDHNKTLIEKMPDVFRSPGVAEPGRTSVHLLTGEGTPFGADQAPGMRDILDGTSNTIMEVIAGPDKAGIWTKPGGLEIDTDEPVKSLGKTGDRFIVGMMDGSVRFLDTGMDPEDLLHLMQHQDGRPVNVPYVVRGPSAEPALAVRCSAAIGQESVVQKLFGTDTDGESITIEGRTATTLRNGSFVIFPNPQTMLLGSETSLKAMLGKRVKSGETRAAFEELYPANDVVVVADLEPLQDELPKLTAGMPMAGMIQNLKHVRLSIDLAGTGKSLNHIAAAMGDAQNAQQLSALATGLYQMQKGQLMALANSENSALSGDLTDALVTIMDSTVIEADGVNLLVDTPKPENSAELLTQFEPAFTELLKGIRSGRKTANRMQKLNQLKQLALALHNYHDTFNGLPSFNTGRADEGKNKGLSWRVHILPYLEQAALYEQFHLDEPWDSKHNKTLIDQMPQLFACEGVNQSGYTSFHAFTGPETPLGAEKPRGFRDITDGLSNTLMIVQAGPDTADVWTKPTGLKFDSENPKKALGQIGEQFMAVFCDGAARILSSDIDDETLSNLIQCADGNPVGDF